MGNSFKTLILLAATVPVLAFPVGLFASNGITIPAGDSFQTATVRLEKFRLGNTIQPAGIYSFEMVGNGKPGEVDVRILDREGKEVAKTVGTFAGKCPGKPTKATFAKLEYSRSSRVKTVKQNKGTGVRVECKRGSRIEFTLDAL